jgi:flagellar protein FlaG
MNIINTNATTQISSSGQQLAQVNQNASESALKISNASDAEVVKKVANTELKNPNVSVNSQPSREAVAKAAEQIQTFVKEMGRNLDFSVDATTGYNVVKVINPETNEIIRQLPSEELLKIARSMESWNSVLVNQKA